jgi:hypothetical protein
MPTRDPANVLAQAREIDAGTKPNDLIVFDGLQWSPAVPYYARRRGMMLVQIIVTPRLLNSLPGQGYSYLYTRTIHSDAFSADALAVLQRWAWFGVVSPHLFRLGASYLSVDSADVAAATHVFEPPGHPDSLISAPRTLVCDASGMNVDVPAGTAITLEFATTTPGDDMSLAVDGRWLPAERTVVVDPIISSRGMLDLGCAGGTDLDLLGAFADQP